MLSLSLLRRQSILHMLVIALDGPTQLLKETQLK